MLLPGCLTFMPPPRAQRLGRHFDLRPLLPREAHELFESDTRGCEQGVQLTFEAAECWAWLPDVVDDCPQEFLTSNRQENPRSPR